MTFSRLIFLFMLICQLSGAQNLAHPQTRLQKLSKALQLINASLEDLQKIATLKNEEEIQNFLKVKSVEYMKTAAFRKKMQFKIEELFKMKASDPDIPVTLNTTYFDLTQKSSFDFLIKD